LIPRRERGISMNSDPMRKLSAALLVLMMTLTALVVLPGPSEVQALGTNNIYVPVVSGGVPVSGATVTLTNVHTGEVIPAPSSLGLYVATNAPSGYYRLDVVDAPGYYNAVDVREFPFYATSSYTVSPQIQLKKFGDSPVWEWNVTVSPAISGVTVSFYNATARQVVVSGTTNLQGYVLLDMYRAGAAADMYLVAQASGYRTNATPVTVTSNRQMTVVLTPASVVSGIITDWDNVPIQQGISAYLLNLDSSKPWISRLMKSTGSYIVFYAEPGDYLLCVDAYGCAAAPVEQIAVSGNFDLGVVQLQNQTQRTEQVDIGLAAAYGSFSLSMATTLSYDETLPGLNYSDVGSLMMQIDLNSQSADGNLDMTEVGQAIAKVLRWGPEELTTNRLLTVNQTLYKNGTFSAFNFGLAAGSVIGATGGVDYSYSTTYTVLGSVEPAAPEYRINATARLDTPAVHHNYSIALPSGYELVDNQTSSVVSVLGYETVVIESGQASGYYGLAELWIEKSLKPAALGAVDSAPGAAYVVENATHVVLKYVARVGVNVTFNAGSSSDPNGNPLMYTWNFNDTTPPVTTSNKTVLHNFTAAAVARMVDLTVTDVAGIQNSTQLTVDCDALLPSPVISVKERTINTTDNSVSLNQRETLIVNATSSTDDVASAGDALGIIDWVQFDYGDNISSNRIAWDTAEQNVTHSYESAGTYTLVLNLTDVVGHWKNTTLTVKVNDTAKPTVSFTAKNETGGSSLVENRTVVFNATATSDNLDNITLLSFSWYFGDSAWFNATGNAGSNVTHNYTSVGTFHVALNVTDLSGNWQKTPKTINILEGPRPKLRIDKIYYSPGNFTEGKQGYILVNLTNIGSRDANNVIVTFSVVRADGTEKLLGTAMSSGGQMFNGSSAVTVVQVGGKVQIRFPVTFGTKGTYSIKVNVTCSEQLTVAKSTAGGDQALHVKEASWKKPVLWGGVAAVIILVPLALYFRGRLAKREKKGPRREKKSEEAE